MKKLFIVFFLLSILVACSNNNSTENTEEEKVLSYSGENEIWKAKIVAKKSDKENLYNYELSIEYKR
ncbi:hypothetical protein FH508_0012275 [Lysinibacillus sp. CD3-6]|uniref:hypothetical protein n=1 Tax=Lysinibacillus sp. CD3-6 TaxID=2892541 RepID=UPI001170A094|nr:hypothetical protein [Lysinibacillus sp. CD3-6]UED78245.1 hypothetical protein FH508_0012275 [Lysinibacillus sp. CD3-6]